MDLIDRYVVAVGRYLPRSQRSDVQQELRSVLEDALEERTQGQPTEEAVIALLKEHGRPEKEASLYWPANSYLIGPQLFPTFKRVTALALAVFATVLTLSVALTLTADPSTPSLGRLTGLLTGVLDSALVSFAVIVLVFSWLQRLGVGGRQAETAWNPLDLPAVAEADLVGRAEAVVGTVVPAILLVLLNLFRSRIGIVAAPGGPVLLNSVFLAHLIWLNMVLFAGMVIHLLLLWLGRWHWFTRLGKIACDLGVVWVLFRIAGGIAAERAVLHTAGLPEPLPVMVVQCGYWVASGVTLAVGLSIVKTVVRQLRRYQAPGSPG